MNTKTSAGTEIDEIFASLKKGASDLSKTTGSLKKEKTSKAKASAEAKDETPSLKPRSGAVESNQVENASNSNTTTSKKRREPETVVDPSIALSSKKRRREVDGGNDSWPSKVNRIDEDLAKFIDSRGAGQRLRTEEGYLIYREDELGIREDGGDTSLCPFDCDCCF